MASASTSKMPPGPPQSVPSSRRSSDTQKIISNFALNRPLPYGNFPMRRPSASSSTTGVNVSVSPPDVNLSGIEGFDYDYDAWRLDPSHPSRKGRAGRKQSITLAEGSISSPCLPIIAKEEGARRKLSRSSNTSSRRSSVEGRMPRLLQQSISPPTTLSHSASAVGKPFTNTRGSKSLAEKGEPSTMPSLYDMSRGRSPHVSLGRRWDDRRGASASVLSGGGEPDDSEGEALERRSARKRELKEARKNSASSLEASLFSSDDGLSPSSEEDEPVHNASRRSSTDRERRRELRVLLGTSQGSASTSSKELQGRESSLTRLTESRRKRSQAEASDSAILTADEESDEGSHTSALLARRRSRSGKRLLSSSLGSSSPRTAATRLDVIQAGLTPDGLTDPLSFQTLGVSDADPLLGSDIGSVLDLVDVEAVEWIDQPKQGSSVAVDSIKLQLQKDRRQSVAEQERERRLGFAAAYQQRLAALIWSKEPAVAKEQAVEDDKAVNENSESANLLTSSLRHILRLPNLLLMPTLGATRMRTTTSEDSTRRQANDDHAQSKAGKVESSSLIASSLSTLVSAVVPVFSESASQAAAREASEFKRRGVMNPLEGDSDVSAYVPGLGLPIDPDLELSSLVHLQTFRTSQTPKSRRGSLEKPASTFESGQHRRSYSDNLTEPAFGLTLETLRSEAFDRGMFANMKDKAMMKDFESKKASRSRREDRRASSARGCSRPAVPAPVPGGYSAYNSSDSGEDEESLSIRSKKKDVDVAKEDDGSRRQARVRRRSTSPPANRKQCAVGLFDSKRRSQHRTEDIANVNMVRVRSTPNLPSLSEKRRNHGKQRQTQSDGRGRGGSVKVVSASIASEDEPVLGSSPVGARPPSSPPQIPPRSVLSSRSALGLGMPGNPAGRPCMVSNGAHLLMLSLELEMMRHRKITCSLKPRWLKARVRSDNNMRPPGVSIVEGKKEFRNFTSPTFMPASGSSLRFEVVPKSSKEET